MCTAYRFRRLWLEQIAVGRSASLSGVYKKGSYPFFMTAREKGVRPLFARRHYLRNGQGAAMKTTNVLYAGVMAVGLALLLSASQASINAGQPAGASVPIDGDDLGGFVSSAKGPEAGVWVIAETADLPTK